MVPYLRPNQRDQKKLLSHTPGQNLLAHVTGGSSETFLVLSQIFGWPNPATTNDNRPHSRPPQRLFQYTVVMGTGKKEASRRERQGKNNDGMGNVRTKV